MCKNNNRRTVWTTLFGFARCQALWSSSLNPTTIALWRRNYHQPQVEDRNWSSEVKQPAKVTQLLSKQPGWDLIPLLSNLEPMLLTWCWELRGGGWRARCPTSVQLYHCGHNRNSSANDVRTVTGSCDRRSRGGWALWHQEGPALVSVLFCCSMCVWKVLGGKVPTQKGWTPKGKDGTLYKWDHKEQPSPWD